MGFAGSMPAFSRACATLVGLVVFAACLTPSVQAAPPYAGRAVDAVLRELAGSGTNFIYNTEIVSPGLLVTAEPLGQTPAAIASEILAPHGLALLPAGENAYSVVRDAGRMAGTIAGRVTDEHGVALAGARVGLAATGRTATTDSRGEFRLADVPAGRYRLDVTADGFAGASLARLRVRAGRTSRARLALTALEPELAEIVVTTSSYALAYNQPQAHTILTQADVQAVPKLADEPLRSVQRLPGSAAAGVSAQSHIRGGEYNETRMVLDGVPLDEPFHLKNLLTPVTVFDARAIESIDVYSGGFSAAYGGAMSGVIDIATLSPPEKRYTELGLSLFHTSALSAGEWDGDRGQWLAGVRRSNLDLISRLADSDFGEVEYFDAIGRASLALSDDTEIFATALTSRDEVDVNTSDETERSNADYRNTYVWAGWQQQWPGALTSRLIVGLTDLDNDRSGIIDDPGRRAANVDDRRTLRTGVARLDVEHRAERAFTRLGVEGREVESKYRYSSVSVFAPDFPLPGDAGGTVTRALDPDPDGHYMSAYFTSRVRLSDPLSVEAGLRWDDQTYDGLDTPEQFAPRLNLMYDLTPETRLRAAWGRFWQAQGPNELQVEDGVDTFYEPQRADHMILSLEQQLPLDHQLRIETYLKDYDRVRPHFENLFDPVKLLPELEPDRVRVAPASARARGVEMLLAHRADAGWSWWLGYGWARVTDRIDGADVVRSWDQRHSVNAGLRYSGPQWEFTVTDSYHTGWPTTELYLVADPDGGPAVATVGPRNGARYDDYNSLDVYIMRRFELEDSTLDAFFEVTNLLWQRNYCCTQYEVTQNDGVTVIDRDLDYWPRFIPSLGVLWRF